jgi:3-deoxy-D-manno-octulosonic-acid transferase
VQREFLSKLRPKHILISRTDLWPEFLTQAKALHIPISMFSAMLSKYSSKIQNGFLKSYQRWLFSHLNHVYCVSEEDKNNFSRLIDSRKITTIGDTRFDQVLVRIAKPNYLKDNLLAKRSERLNSVFIAGSTWPEDEKEILPIFRDLIRNTVQVILVPHEPTEAHIASLKKQISAMGIRPLLYSEAVSWPPNQVLIVDQVGILADLYAWADWAFVGGSFKRQVHSVLVRLAHGCKTFFGPYHGNSREAIMFKSMGFANGINSGQQMLQLMLRNRNMETSNSFKEQLKETVKARSGASEALVATILRPTHFS